jgi:hypothetical protein
MLETLILEAVRDRLNLHSNELLEKQIQAINIILRTLDSMEADFYRMKGGQPSFDKNIALTNKTDELLFAKVQVRIPDFRAVLVANLWCEEGFLSSIKYEGNVNYFEEAAGMDPRPIFLIDCEMIADLSQSS